jgi:hypothetical protein
VHAIVVCGPTILTIQRVAPPECRLPVRRRSLPGETPEDRRIVSLRPEAGSEDENQTTMYISHISLNRSVEERAARDEP